MSDPGQFGAEGERIVAFVAPHGGGNGKERLTGGLSAGVDQRLVCPRPGSAVDTGSHLFAEQRQEDLFRDVGQDRREEQNHVTQNALQSVPPSLMARIGLVVETLLGHLQIVVGELGPEELLDLVLGRRVLVFLERCGDAADEALGAREDPAVGGREGGWTRRRLVSGDEALRETSDIPQLGDQLGAGRDFLLTDDGIPSEAGAGRPVASGVRRVALQHLQRRHRATTAAAFADLLRAPGSQAPARHEDLPPRKRAEAVMRHDDGVEGPGADDLVCLGPQRHRKNLFVEGGVGQAMAGDLGGAG